MESNRGEAMPDLISQMVEKSRELDFFQAVSLLEEYFQKEEAGVDPLNSNRVQFYSDTATAFPPSDIAKIESDKEGFVRFVLSFMGLLGISSPLPQYFIEYGYKHEGEETALSDFLSIFNHRFYVLFYRAWKKYRIIKRLSELDPSGLFQKIAFLSGIDEKNLQKRKRMVAYTGILTGSCRSAEGLRTVISDFFGNIPVAIRQWIPRWAKVDELKKIGEDSVLGSTAMCGTHIRDTGGMFMIILGPLEKETFEAFLPDSPNIVLLKEIVDKYMTDPLEFSVEVKLKPSALIPVVLGKEVAPLGITSSCGPSLEKSDDYSILIGS